MLIIHKTAQAVNHRPDDVFLHFTGNIFGIGCSAFSQIAVNRIKNLKQRIENKGFILIFSSIKMLLHYIPSLQTDTGKYNLLNQYYPGNLTAILPCNDERLTHIMVDGKIAVRIPLNETLREFIDQIGVPIVSTSINISDAPYINDLSVLQDDFQDWFDYGLYNPQDRHDLPLPSTIISFDEGLSLIRDGSIPFSEVTESFTTPLIQFVCIGNICRSPMAQIYFNHLINEKGLPYRTASCGLVNGGIPISENSKLILEREGYNTHNRHSIQVNADIMRQSQILLCMTKDIKQNLTDRFPEYKHKIYTLAEYTGNTEDISDPYQKDITHYEKAWQGIREYVDRLICIR